LCLTHLEKHLKADIRAPGCFVGYFETYPEVISNSGDIQIDDGVIRVDKNGFLSVSTTIAQPIDIRVSYWCYYAFQYPCVITLGSGTIYFLYRNFQKVTYFIGFDEIWRGPVTTSASPRASFEFPREHSQNATRPPEIVQRVVGGVFALVFVGFVLFCLIVVVLCCCILGSTLIVLFCMMPLVAIIVGLLATVVKKPREYL
jgi:hypothetical protein